jgi:hypothetical protein
MDVMDMADKINAIFEYDNSPTATAVALILTNANWDMQQAVDFINWTQRTARNVDGKGWQ